MAKEFDREAWLQDYTKWDSLYRKCITEENPIISMEPMYSCDIFGKQGCRVIHKDGREVYADPMHGMGFWTIKNAGKAEDIRLWALIARDELRSANRYLNDSLVQIEAGNICTPQDQETLFNNWSAMDRSFRSGGVHFLMWLLS